MNPKPSFTPFSFNATAPFVAASNPFMPASEPRLVEEVAPAVDAVWSHDSGDADDFGTPTAEAIDVRVLWGTNVLHFEQMSPPRPFTLGGAGSDFTLPEVGELTMAATMGRSCPLVVLHGDQASVFVAPGASVEVKLVNGNVLTLAQCAEKGMANASSDRTGAHEIALPHGAMATVRLLESDLVFEVTRARARQQPVTGFLAGADLSGQIYTGLSALAHAAVIGTLAFFLPSMHNDDAESVDRNAAAAMQPYLTAIAEREPEHQETVSEAGASAPGGAAPGSQAAGPSGVMGQTVPTPSSGHFAIRGDAQDPKIAREAAMAEAAKFGMLGLLNTDADASNAPVAPWGESAAMGHDSRNALGSLFAQTLDDAMGMGGLGMSGNDQGGGGLYHGIGIDGVGTTIGGGHGCPVGVPCDGYGPGHGPGPGGFGIGSHPGGGGHVPHAPIMRNPTVEVNGTLPGEVIQRIVRQNFGRFRLCYEGGLRANPGLTGRVAVSFMIDRNGSVAVAAADRSTDMADPNVVSCVVRGFQNLTFPEPKNGMVKVVYPLLLSPGE